MKADFSKIAEKLTQKGKNSFFIAMGVIGMLLITVADYGGKTDSVKKDDSISLQNYKYQLEKEVAGFIKEIDGVGEARVMISFEAGEENVYAQKEKSSTDSSSDTNASNQSESNHLTYENEYVIIDNSGEETALIEKVLQPTIQGVAVVCDGADDISVVAAVTNSVSVVLNVPTHKICVTKMR